MSALQSWLEENKMAFEFQKSELCRLHNLEMVTGNGVISFTGGDGSPLANEVVGKLYTLLLEEVDENSNVEETVDIDTKDENQDLT